MTIDEYAEEIKRLLDRELENLASIEKVHSRLGSQELGAPDVDITEHVRKHIKSAIATYQDILARLAGSDE